MQTLSGCNLQYLVHNAATVEPLKPLIEVTLEEWKNAISINLEAPIFLTQDLYSLMSAGTRILNISSGLAHTTLPGLSVYSITKSALLMAYNAFKEELLGEGILFGSVQPGIVDTDMQMNLRDEKHKKHFSSQAIFEKFKRDDKLISPEEALLKLLRCSYTCLMSNLF